MDVDSDEYLYISKGPIAAQPGVSQNSMSVGILNEFLSDVEASMPDACGFEIPWRMMYGEHSVLRSQQLLMDNFVRICFSHSQKVLFNTARATYQPPHWCQCKDKGAHKAYPADGEQRQKALPQYSIHLLHYYAKSIEEYILKSEQSQPPFFRKMRDMYDPAASSCENTPVPFDILFGSAVQRIMQGRKEAQGGMPDGGVMLGPLPEYKPHSREDYALYLFLKVSSSAGWRNHHQGNRIEIFFRK